MRLGLVVIGIVLSLGVLAWADGLDDFERAWRMAGDDPISQEQALEHLAADGSDRALQLLVNIAKSPESHYRVADAAEQHLWSLSSGAAVDWMGQRLSRTRDDSERVILARALGRIGGSDATGYLIEALGDDNWSVQAAVIEGLRGCRSLEVVDALVAALKEAEGRVQADLIGALEQLTGHSGPSGFDGWDSWWSVHREGFTFGRTGPTQQTGGTEVRYRLYDEIVSDRVIFIIDISGSMQVTAGGGDFMSLSRLDYVKMELANVLQSELTRDKKFNIIVFSDDVRPWQRSMKPGTEGNIQSAVAFVNALSPEGGTNSFGSLELALSDPSVDTIYFLSDGTPTVGEVIEPLSILGRIQSLNRTRNVRINTIAFLAGDGASFYVIEDKPSSRSFMQRLAEQNNGSYRNVE